MPPKPCQVMVVPRALMGVKSVSYANSVSSLEYTSMLVLNTYHFSGSCAMYRCPFSRLALRGFGLILFLPVYMVCLSKEQTGAASFWQFDVIIYGDRLEHVTLMPRSGNPLSGSHVGTLINPAAAFWQLTRRFRWEVCTWCGC